jgi:hypothetical protein
VRGCRPGSGARAALVPTDLELHSGMILGSTDAAAPSIVNGDFCQDPRRALEDVIAAALAQGPCLVQFSGGRDSSLVLAVAAHVARREGLPLPLAVTLRHPGDPAAEESEWQDLVVGRLAVPHEVIVVADGDLEVAGWRGVGSLLRHGPLMPATLGPRLAALRGLAAGFTVLTGEGGDEVLGDGRITAFVAQWRRRRRPTWERVRLLGHDLLPRPARRVVAAHHLRAEDLSGWLRPAPARLVQRAVLDELTDAPWDWRVSRWQVPTSRAWRIGAAQMDEIAEDYGFRLLHPLLDAHFVSALCAAGGFRGLTTRTEAMRLLGGDLLPRKLVERRTKSYFNEVYGGDRLRRFAAQWDGSGVDPELVDPESLRATWSDPSLIPAASLAPLQLALLEATRQGWEPEPRAGAAR